MGVVKRSLWIGAAVVVLVAGSVVALAQTGGSGGSQQRTNAEMNILPITANLNTANVPISAPVGELVNVTTGQVLFASHIVARHYPASIVKLMTALIALENVQKGRLSLHSIIPVSNAAYQVAKTPGLSVAYLDQSEQIPLSKMLEYMFVVSADDAAVAVGDYFGGSETGFAHLMNAKAATLGMTGTHYTNASGLQNPQQYTNARDIAILSRYLLQHFPIVLRYASEQGMYTHPGQYGNNYDQLLGQYRGLDGLKTGSTDQAGYCFVGTAKRGNTRLLSVVLGATSFNNVFQDTTSLLDFGFKQFHTLHLQDVDQTIAQMSVPNGSQTTLAVAPKQAVNVEVLNGTRTHVLVRLSTTQAKAPIIAGQAVGHENIVINGHTVEQVPLYALADDKPAGEIQKLWESFMSSLHAGAKDLVHAVTHKLGKYL